ncbi:hypothetical protein BJ322DRAFT_212132 [Thelephora terrestris]|uniref:DUF6533 domain-containing protein n=1 Tax=Thelephora terrestris TaxID=56493 RepID=A0A9P6H998_9AGAM|nr:hypothetical protein BJ322DRAFT_212132 [Thelephora terrestris]
MGGILDQSSAVQRYLYISATALCIYDHLLLFDDEVRYYWKDRRSWMFALYFLYRCILVGFHFWRVYFVILTPDGPELIYTADTFVQLSVTVISLACLDGLITLRCVVFLQFGILRDLPLGRMQ